jgi:hypothetical protein
MIDMKITRDETCVMIAIGSFGFGVFVGWFLTRLLFQ